MMEQTAGGNEGGQRHVECGRHLNIGGVTELRNILGDSINNNREITIEITDPERIDTAGIQLLYSIVNEARSRKVNLSWGGELPDHFTRVAALLGMGGHLGLPKQRA